MEDGTGSAGKFYELSLPARLKILQERGLLSAEEVGALSGEGGLSLEQADKMVENVAGIHALPLGIAQNFLINGKEVLVPMAIEEPSVVAGASFMAKLVRAGGGFTAHTTAPEMIGQMQILGVENVQAARLKLLENKARLLAEAADADPMLIKLGGGPRDIEVRIVQGPAPQPFLVMHLIFDVRDAMGANAINTATERLSPLVESITGGKVLLRILSNLADRRLARARCVIPLEVLAFGNYSAEEVRDGVIQATWFAAADPYRAATHNKGIMNGVDAVVLATGNDWRAVEAGAHAYAARSGQYTSLSTWSKSADGGLEGTLEMPMAVGIVGGATRVHPTARAVLKVMGVKTAAELAEIIVSVGLAQNLAALRALATEGIQSGHMTLHARQVALAAGAEGTQIEELAAQLVREGKIHIERAGQILQEWQG